jgi:hypothetical protein
MSISMDSAGDSGAVDSGAVDSGAVDSGALDSAVVGSVDVPGVDEHAARAIRPASSSDVGFQVRT